MMETFHRPKNHISTLACFSLLVALQGTRQWSASFFLGQQCWNGMGVSLLILSIPGSGLLNP